MKRIMIALLAASALPSGLSAQNFDMKQWGADRGYYDAPYFRYEAERDHCREFTGTYLAQSDIQTDLQSEASNQQAVTLGNGQYVSWQNTTGAADGVTLRFSVPWGSTAQVGIYGENGDELAELSLNTEHSWEFCPKVKGRRDYKPEHYSAHVYNANEFARMRFDEVHKLLSREIRQGEKFSIRNKSNTPVTVDFLEIEKARFVPMQDGWVRWNQDIEQNLQAFIDRNQGRTIYIDQPYVGVWGKLNVGNCTLQGRGIFYTELHWEQNGAGFNAFDGAVRDMALSSYQQQRYGTGSTNDHSSMGYSSPGKCFNGKAGRVENVLVEHFECGGWLSGGSGSHFSHCRFRNNYADGINFCNSSNCTFEHSSFRNNGDDDMASWSAEAYCSNNTFRYCTAEHNWRASSLGFFGGGGHKAHNLLIKDGLENGVRLVSDFSGPAFGQEGTEFHDISIVHCACINGEVGVHGDFWGVDEGALHIEASRNYAIPNGRFHDIDIIDSRGNAVFIGSGSHSVDNLSLSGINIDGVRDPGSYAIYFENPRGSATLTDITVNGADRLTNVNGGNIEGASISGFNLTVNNVTGKPVDTDAISGCNLALTALAWESKPASRADMPELSEGDAVTFSARIDNLSATDFPKGYPLQTVLEFSNGTRLTFSSPANGIKGGDHAIVTATWTAAHGGHTVVATLDPSNRLGDAVNASKLRIEKRFNVKESSVYDLPFDRTSGVDFIPLGLAWSTDGSDNYGREAIRVGDQVRFAAIVANAGTDYSAGGTKMGVIISPGGNEWSLGDTDLRWSDGEAAYAEMQPGQVRAYPACGGNNNAGATWTARQGTFNVLVQVNDHANESGNRSESNTANNKAHYGLTIPYTPSALLDEAVLTPPDALDIPSEINGITMTGASVATDSAWYTLTGLRLTSRPTQPGLYIRQGRKIVIR